MTFYECACKLREHPTGLKSQFGDALNFRDAARELTIPGGLSVSQLSARDGWIATPACGRLSPPDGAAAARAHRSSCLACLPPDWILIFPQIPSKLLWPCFSCQLQLSALPSLKALGFSISLSLSVSAGHRAVLSQACNSSASPAARVCVNVCVCVCV